MGCKVIVLGSAQDGGLPQLGATARNDLNALQSQLPSRTGASLVVASGNGDFLLIDASPDLRWQHNSLRISHPELFSADKPLFHSVVLTHAHMGHYVGLVHLGKESANCDGIPTIVTPQFADFLTSNAPWSQLVKLNNISLQPIQPKPYNEVSAIDIWEGLTIKCFTVPHRAEFTDTIGVSINGEVLYIPDIDDWESWQFAEEAISSHRICLVDSTFYDLSELKCRDLKSIPHPPTVDTIARFGHLVGPSHERQIVLTHLNHSNPLCDKNSKEYQHVKQLGFDVAEDEQIFTLTRT